MEVEVEVEVEVKRTGGVPLTSVRPSAGSASPAELALHDGSTGAGQLGQHEQLEAVPVGVRPVGARECEQADAGPGRTRRA